MTFDLENESICALPERLETSDTNWSSVAFSQGNLGIQLGGLSLQAMGQANLAGVTVIQSA